MKTSDDFKTQVREKWGLPIEVGKVALSELFTFGDVGHHRHVMAALTVGIILGETKDGDPEVFIRRFEAEIHFAL